MPQGLTLSQDRLAFPLSGHWWDWRGPSGITADTVSTREGTWSQGSVSPQLSSGPPFPEAPVLTLNAFSHPPVQVSRWSRPSPRAASQEPGHRPSSTHHPRLQASSRVGLLARRGPRDPWPALLGVPGYSQDWDARATVSGETGVAWNHSRVCRVPLNSGTRATPGQGGPSPPALSCLPSPWMQENRGGGCGCRP